MKKEFLVGGCALLFGMALFLVDGSAGETSAEAVVSNFAFPQEKISLDLRDIDIKEALKFIATKANVNIIPSNDINGRVTLMVNEAPIEDVFQILIRSNTLAYEKVGAIYSVMTEEEYKKRYGKKFDDIRQIKIFHLNYVSPEQAFNVIDSIKSSIGKVLADNDSGTLMVLDTPEKILEAEETLRSLERKSTIKVFTLSYAKADDVVNQLRTQLDLKNVGSIRADERTNQVIVQTLPDRMPDVEQLIASLDKKTKEVLIDARIVQVKLKNDLSEGVQWEGLFELASKNGETTYAGTYPVSSVDGSVSTWRSRKQVLEDTGYVGSYPFSGSTANFSASSPKSGLEEMHIGVIGNNDYDVLVRYLKTLGEVRILSNPKLAVTNNQEARIHVGEKQAYITTTTTAGQTTTTVSEQVTFLDVGLQLFITPIINDLGFVTLDIKPELSSVIGSITTAQNNKIPIIDTSTAETTVMVKDGSTVVVGGLRREENTLESKQVPILSSIPILGVMFKSEAKGSTRNELLVMITAHIIEGDELTTGSSKDFGGAMENKYQPYEAITKESELTGYEESHGKIKQKAYQPYPDVGPEPEYNPTLKPMKDD